MERQDLPGLKSLLPKTSMVFKELFDPQFNFLKNYVLVGGTALALHLQHRQSEDLDFFTFQDYYNIQSIENIKKLMNHFSDSEILNETEEQIDILINDVNITFFNAKWEFLKPSNIQQVNIASIYDIAAMKINALYVRAKFRDYYDLFFITQKIGIEKLFNQAKKVIPGLNFKIFAMALVYTDDILEDNIDNLKPTKKITKDMISSYFVKELNKFK